MVLVKIKVLKLRRDISVLHVFVIISTKYFGAL